MQSQENNPSKRADFQDKLQKRPSKNLLQQSFSEHGRVPPQAVDLEEAVLGALMLEQNALTAVIDILKPELFYKEAHQVIFKAIHSLFAKSEPVDILTVTNELKSTGNLELVGGAYFISQLTNRVASTANIEYHARIISQKYIQRELIKISSEIIKDAFEDTTDVFELLDKAEQNLFSVSENNFRRDYDSMQALVREAIKDIESARDHEGNLRGIPSGFTDLDRITAGWQKSDLVILAARPGMGKTAFVLSMARNIAVDFNVPLAIFSLEMSSIQLVTRLISSETQLSADKLKKGNLENYEWEQLNAKIGKLVDAPLYIDDTPALSIFELRAKCRRLKAQHNIQMIIIDYIQLMSVGGDNKGNREQEISTISRSLKALAKELSVPVITLSQLNRSVETRGGSKRPILSDLRESGAIEQDADMVMFIYRPEYYKIDQDEEGNPTKGMAELIIAKHRNGALADVKMQFIDRFAKFIDYEGGSFDLPGDLPSEYDYPGENSYTVQSRMNDMADDDQPF
ncbi:MAG: replicative DNA helicase [Bacteroidales bacterium]|nr:replicative DNA helicase [Bacteroidales bacterium]MCF8404565.1 replicative DNA helicase [Bacteroidales bacterium]